MATKTSTIQVIDRMVTLLDAIATYDDTASLKFLSADTGLHPSTTYRILASLVEQGLVVKSSSGTYQFGHKLMEWGCRVHVQQDIRQEAQPFMVALKNEIAETVNLSITDGDHLVYIERAIPDRMMRVEHVIGSRSLLHVTAVGKLILSMKDEKIIDEYAKRTRLSGITKNTLTTLKDLKVELGSLVKQDYALDKEEKELGVGCIGALIYNITGNVVAGLSVSAPIERLHSSLIPKVVTAANEISMQLGYHKKS